MARERKRKPQPAADEPAPALPPETEVTEPVVEQPAPPPPVEQAPDVQPQEEGERKFTDAVQKPVGRHTIDLGDGRLLKLSRSNRWQQMRIEFKAQREDVDPRPAKEDTEFMKGNGWRWRAEEKAWTRQLERNSDENRFARADSDRQGEDQFVELANRIRARNGLEPVSYQLGNGIV